MARLDPTTRLHRERAARTLRVAADDLRHLVAAHQLYLPRGMGRTLSQLGAQLYRHSRMLDPMLLAADRRKLEAVLRRAALAGHVPELAGLSLDELAELLHPPTE